MDYTQALQYLESFINYEKVISFDYKESLGLDRMRCLAAALGNPQDGLRCIHITGTKGKGSTSVMVASILREAGFKVGLYTSPHLVSFRERIRINDELITETELRALVERVKAALGSVDKDSDDCPTFFEVYTAIAFLYFERKKTDFCVLEVGMGGRLDATNIIEKPLCCGITNISYEHTQKLGATLSKIAREKSGIIKKGSICVSSLQETGAADVIRKTCAGMDCALYEVGRDISYSISDRRDILVDRRDILVDRRDILVDRRDILVDRRDIHVPPKAGLENPAYPEARARVFSVKGLFEEYPFLELGLLGDHQFMNAATALGLIESLRFYDIMVKTDAIRLGLKNVSWPGRMQVLRRSPYVVLDGAQNRASAAALAKAVREYFEYDKLILVLGVSKDKDIKGICEELGPVSDKVILTRAKIQRAEDPETIKKFFDGAVATNSIQEAMDLAERSAGPQDLILVTGSFFVLGEALLSETLQEAGVC